MGTTAPAATDCLQDMPFVESKVVGGGGFGESQTGMELGCSERPDSGGETAPGFFRFRARVPQRGEDVDLKKQKSASKRAQVLPRGWLSVCLCGEQVSPGSI